MSKVKEANTVSVGQKIGDFSKKNAIVLVLIILCVGFAIGNPNFLQAKNLVNLTTQMAINAVLTIGLTYVIILGGIDISVGSVAAMAGVASALICRELPAETPLAVMILVQVIIGLVVGMVFGAFNGFMITKFNVVPMIATLASQTAARGLAYIFSGGTSVSGLTSVYSWLGSARLLKTEGAPNGWIPVITIVVVVVVFLMHILLSKTVFGRHVFATGSNSNVAHLSGINTNKVTFLCYAICGAMAGLAGVLNSSKLQNGQPGACESYEMYAIASTVMGGTSLLGGSGSVARAMFGCATVAVINNGMNLLHIDSYWQKVVLGIIILLAVVMDMAQKKKKD